MMTKHNVFMIFRYLSILLLVVALFHQKVLAGPACDRVFVITQPSGHSFAARQKGDEWHNWLETKNGYGIFINGSTGKCEYRLPSDGGKTNASLSGKKALPEAVVGEVDPAILSIPKGLRPPRKIFTGANVEMVGPSNSNSKGTARGSSRGSPISSGPQVSGTRNLLVIGVDFSDQPASYSAAQVQSLIFGTGGSLADYYSDVSYSSLTVSPAIESHNAQGGAVNDGFIGWLRLSGNHPDTAGSTGVVNAQLTKDAILAADQFIDFSQYDTSGNGIVDPTELSIIIIVAGYEKAYAPTPGNSVWAHQWDMAFALGPANTPNVDGKTVHKYAQFGERHNDHLATMGVICHEMGHLMLSLPDLYDINSSNGPSEGIGAFGLMGSGSWGAAPGPGQEAGTFPTHLCAWSKKALGWGTVTIVNTNQQITFPKADTNSNSIFMLATLDPNQYFLIENRQFTGYDIGFNKSHSLWAGPSGHGGLAIYHIDESNFNNADENNKMVDVEEANEVSHGSSMLDNNDKRVDTDMFYFSGNNSDFSVSTIPGSKLNNGTNSDISITNISIDGDIMTANVQITILADLTADSTCGAIPFTVKFTNNSSVSGPGFTYLWDFGDGNTSAIEDPSHTYMVDGIFTVSLTVQDTNGSDTKTIPNYIKTNSQYLSLSSNDPGGPAFNWIEISGTGTPLSPGDDASSPVSLPFSFEFYGTNYSQINVNSNGNLRPGNALIRASNVSIPTTGTTEEIIAAYWDDFNPPLGGNVYTQSIGTSPNRTFIIEWYKVPHFDHSIGDATFEIILHEGSNEIVFQYLDVNLGIPALDNGISATVGIQSVPNACESKLYSFNQAVLSDQLAIQFVADIDNDGIPDPWEISNFGDLTTADGTTDFEGDGMLDIDEFINKTNPKVADTDGDGVNDPIDNCPITANPGQEDIDGDGIGDECEGRVEVDFAAISNGDGTPGNPFNNLTDASNAVNDGGTINILGGTMSETLTIDRPGIRMIIKTADGFPVIIGQ